MSEPTPSQVRMMIDGLQAAVETATYGCCRKCDCAVCQVLRMAGKIAQEWERKHR